MLIILRYYLCISWICCQVNGECDKLFAYNWLWTMNYQLINERNAFCICKCCFQLVFLGQMIQEFEYESAKAWSFKNLDKFWDQTILLNLLSNAFVE